MPRTRTARCRYTVRFCPARRPPQTVAPAPGTHENRRCEIILAAPLCRAIFVGTRKAGASTSEHLRPSFRWNQRKPNAPLPPAKNSVRHAIARRDAKLLGGATDHLEHRTDRAAGWDERFRERHRVLGNSRNAPIAADEDHVERDIGVLHPEARGLVVAKIEQHALALRQLAPEHQPLGLLLRRDRHLDRKDMNAVLAGDFERFKPGGGEAPGRAERRQEQHREQGEKDERATAHEPSLPDWRRIIAKKRPGPSRPVSGGAKSRMPGVSGRQGRAARLPG